MSRHVWLRFLAGVFLLVCAPVFGLVETDNPLLGVLREQNFTVIQDLGVIHAKLQGLPSLEIRDGVDTSAYEVTCKLNTMLYSGTHRKGLARFVSEHRETWKDMQLDSDPDARFVSVSWSMTTGRDPDAYRRQLNEWKRDVAGLNAAIYRTLDKWGPDPKEFGPQQEDVEVVELGGGVKLEMVYIRPGTFMMGSPTSEAKRDDDEKQHQVTLSEGFWMGKYEVTQEQWETIMGSNPSHFKGARNPVEQVSWRDCQAFIRKLNSEFRIQHSGDGGFRLPTEAEWEYACRAGTTTPFAFGDCLSTDDANYYGYSPMSGCSKGAYREKTLPVGSLRANDWGLYDMHGNVWEWCQDWYGDYPSGAVTDPVGPGSGESRVFRGGSWDNSARGCRSADRSGCTPGGRDDLLGFRLARNNHL